MANDEGLLFEALRRGWWVLLVAILFSVGTAWWITSREEPRFAAEALLVVAPHRNLKDPSDIIRSIETLERRTVLATLAKIPGRAETKELASAELGWDTATLRRYWIGGSVVPQTNLLRIQVQGPDAEGAARLATAAAHATRHEADRIYRVYYLRMLEEAEVSRRPIRPQPGRNLLVAGVLGLFVGIGAALSLEILRRRGRSR